MRTFVHGDLSIAVHEDWLDESQIAFAEPPDASMAQEMAQRAAASGAPIPREAPGFAKPRSNFVMTQRAFDPEAEGIEDVRAFCAEEVPRILSQIPNHSLGKVYWAPFGDGEAAVVDVQIQMEDGATLAQVHALSVAHGRVFHFVGTTTPGQIARKKPLFLEMMASVQISPKTSES